MQSNFWTESVKGYEWPDQLKNTMAKEDISPIFNRKDLLKLAHSNAEDDYFVLTFLSIEYFDLGLIWVRHAIQAGVKRFAIAATDTTTAEKLNKLNIPFFMVELHPIIVEMAYEHNLGGFNGKAMALINCRTQIIKFLLESGINVLSCDIDALIIKNPSPFLKNCHEITFQRVVYFPKPIARVWGFTACCGFVAFRTSDEAVRLLNQVINIQKIVSSDQLALNLTLWKYGVEWTLNNISNDTDEMLIKEFTAMASKSIFGRLPETKIRLEALPATTFWRHKFVSFDRNSIIVLHPNSPKSLQGKLDLFSKYLQ